MVEELGRPPERLRRTGEIPSDAGPIGEFEEPIHRIRIAEILQDFLPSDALSPPGRVGPEIGPVSEGKPEVATSLGEAVKDRLGEDEIQILVVGVILDHVELARVVAEEAAQARKSEGIGTLV